MTGNATILVFLLLAGLMIFVVLAVMAGIVRRPSTDGPICRAAGCNRQNEPGAHFCARCGAALTNDAPPPAL